MELILKSIFLLIILVLIDAKRNSMSTENSDNSKNKTLIDKNEFKSGDKSADLVASDQHFRYSYDKNDFDSYGNNNYANNGKSYLKEVHYFHDKQLDYERKLDWSSDSDEEIVSKKIKKDLYNKRNNGKNYNFDDMIEIKKWDDEEPVRSKGFYDNYDHGNNGNNNNYHENKSKISFFSNINQKINKNNNENYKSDDNKDKHNYSQQKYGTEDRAMERGRGFSGFDEDNQKWFTNMEDKDQSGSNDNEVKDEDNYNNFNSPKFIVNFNSFKPWNKIMRNRRHEDNSYEQGDKVSVNLQDNYEIYGNSGAQNEDNASDEKFNYEPKFLTNLGFANENKNNYNNNENYDKNKIYSNDKQKTYKTTDFKETVKKLKSRPKNTRYHYEKRVVPHSYSTTRPKSDTYGNGYESVSRHGNTYSSLNTDSDKPFIEMPYDMFNTGWSSVQKPLRHRSNRKAVPVVKQYRYGF